MPESKKSPQQKNNKNLVALIILGLILILGLGFFLKKDGVKNFDKSNLNVEEQAKILFVLHGEAIVENNVLAINPQHVHWFTDRPLHDAGQMDSEFLVNIWGEIFASSSPNAAIVGEATNAVVVLENATMKNGKIIFNYQTISGELAEGKPGVVSVFIDSGGGNMASNVDGIAEIIQGPKD